MSQQQGAQAEQAIGAFTIADPLSAAPAGPVEVPEPDEQWLLPNGFAHVYYAEGRQQLEKPVIMADGFNLGKSDLKWLYAGLEADFPLISRVRQAGRDVILLGFDERTSSIVDNAGTAVAAIMEAITRRAGDSPLAVGGFSMGGLITRYALAKLEMQRMDHQTALYFSYDTPHRGGVIPVGLQAFSHFIPLANDFARQMNSPAARQMLWRHYDSKTGEIRVDPLREQFLADLRRLGDWPRRPRLIAVANGRGDGIGLPDVPPGEVALKVDRIYPGTTFHTQAQGSKVTAAQLYRKFPQAEKTITTDGFPELDGAPGGTLNSYKILADMLKKFGAEVDLRHEHLCFVPSVSAVAVRDIDAQKDLYADISSMGPDESELDEYFCSPTTTGHTEITEELCTWLLERLP
ncbi:hypothetical protein ABT381_31020 [Streptomyces sp. NPDC000151]|uniref:esterase/lipase family protein n=1 Tax=Streptomyces sp. NPDC000151 TaxID=3154244 RepID=UPI0033213F21